MILLCQGMTGDGVGGGGEGGGEAITSAWAVQNRDDAFR